MTPRDRREKRKVILKFIAIALLQLSSNDDDDSLWDVARLLGLRITKKQLLRELGSLHREVTGRWLEEKRKSECRVLH
jgi:hypothetical protein